MAERRYEFRVSLMVTASFQLAPDAVLYQQGLRQIAIPLARVTCFAVKERRPFLGATSSLLLFRLGSGKLQRTLFDPASPACRAFLDALRARLPVADATQLAWPDAAARLGVTARPWYEGLLHPRAVFGIVMLGANAATAGIVAHGDRAERMGAGIGARAITLVAIYLIVTGVRRSRR